MSSVISKGQLSAFQRWEMASFGDTRVAQMEEQQLASAAAAKISQAEIDQLRKIAQQEGYAAGYKEAYAMGLLDGQQAGYAEAEQNVLAEISALHDVAREFSEQLTSAGKQIGQDILSLALDLSQAMLKAKFEIDPAVIIPIVQNAVDQLPSVQQPAQIFLHPDDADLIKKSIGDALYQEGWRVVSDHHMERGGCKLETAYNLVDASYSTRWQRLTEAIKQNVAPVN